MIKFFILLFFIILTNTVHLSFAATEKKKDSTALTLISEFNLSADVLGLVELSKNEPNKARALLQGIVVDVSTFNYAEQYLILLVKAELKQQELLHQDVISLIEQAKLLRKHIIEKQLDLPLFSNGYLVLANSYAAIKDYDKAYQAKKSFVDEYNDYSDARRENTVKALTKKYEIAHKIEVNELLDNQNKLKKLLIGDVRKQQEDQQLQFVLIICTILLFILLFLRQLKVRKKLLFLTKTDSLTGLLNRSALFNKGKTLVESSNKHNLELSLLLFDIDHFKLVNDNFGHHVGDLVLERIAQLVSETMRARDVLSRLGGEEFVVLLPNTDIDKAKAIAVRVMEKISSYDFSELGVDRAITLSIGVANLKDTKAIFDDVLHAADLAMYQAKAQGRNQMVSYESISDDQERRQL
ncbi:MAG: GGDEF domain-containing protein [Gammaproteobacteria bacterium]|nr:MAG: GGDEF domain-containing protein [Gammaproteobacteria bacterium]